MKATDDDVRHAYRLLLGREPDPAGTTHFQNMIAERSLAPDQLAGYFLGSPEFLARHSVQHEPIDVDLDGYVLYVRAHDHDIGSSVLGGVYEPHVTAVVKEVLKSGDTFVDVGANIGYFAAMGAHLVGASGHVVAIEPMDKNVQLILATVWRNRFENVVVLPYAASTSERIVPMATNLQSSNGEVVQASPEGHTPALFAQARKLDDMLKDLERLDLIKFDVEGHELLAWRGFVEGLARHKPLILTEFHPKCIRDNAAIEPAEYLEVLFDYAQSVYVLHSPTERQLCQNGAQVMAEWEAADRRLNSGGTTHLDLFLRPKGR